MAKIVIIDDSVSVRMQLRQTLSQAGHEVVEASDGADGLEKILANADADLVISDFNMPGSDGLTMLAKAKEKLGSWPFPVFMLTTETSEELKTRGKVVGVLAWIIKPYVDSKLLQAIERGLALKKTV